MKIAVVMDSFKGSMTSLEAGEAVKNGIKRAAPDAEVVVKPIADGGEGTVDALVCGMNGSYRQLRVTGPLGEKVDCTYGILPDEQTAVMEMSAAAGLPLIPPSSRNPLYTTTRGVGEMILDAIEQGCRRFIIGIGGSATNDGGVGMLQALGFDFLDRDGNAIRSGAQGLQELVRIDNAHVLPQLKECSFRIACDVSNPLCGENGCSAVYGPQKGATSESIERMDRWLNHYAQLAKQLYPQADAEKPGTGAAGGMGFAFLTFLNAQLIPGIQLVMEEMGAEQLFQQSDLVITGEGRLDGQTMMGKVPVGVAALAKKHHKPVVALAGCTSREATACNGQGIDAFFPILREVVTLEQAMQKEQAMENLMLTAEQVLRLWKASCR